MLTGMLLRALKPKEKTYKVSDQRGLYAADVRTSLDGPVREDQGKRGRDLGKAPHNTLSRHRRTTSAAQRSLTRTAHVQRAPSRPSPSRSPAESDRGSQECTSGWVRTLTPGCANGRFGY